MRREHDFYETPPHYLEALYADMDFNTFRHRPVIEPCVGEGAISKALTKEFNLKVLTNDIDKKRKADSHFDAAGEKFWTGEEWALSITNPPFNAMEDIVSHMLEHSENVITLARLSFLEPTQKRTELFKRYGDPTMLIVLSRYSFRLNDEGKRATDSMTCCWIGWGPELPKELTIWTP